MRQTPAVLTTQELQRLVEGTAPPWLVYVPDGATFTDGHIPGSLDGSGPVSVRLFLGAVVVVYGEDTTATNAPRLATLLQSEGVTACWYAEGLHGWAADGLPVDRLG